jgi:hypothetical protein
MATSFSGGRSQCTWREPPTMDKQLVNFITCGYESGAPFFVIYKAGLALFESLVFCRPMFLLSVIVSRGLFVSFFFLFCSLNCGDR